MVLWCVAPMVALVFGCGGKDSSDTGGEGGRTEAIPAVTIVAPLAPVAGPDVTVEVEVQDFALTEATASLPPRLLDLVVPVAQAHEPSASPEGFVVLRLDGDEVARGAQTTFVLEDVAAGTYQLQAELLWPDGDAFFPAVRDEVELVVE